jgi:curved DNA-binding protein CbpA
MNRVVRSLSPTTGRTTADLIHPGPPDMSSSHQPDPYTVLGVDPTATTEQITHAYRALLRRHHPDTRAESPTEQMHTDPVHADDARLQLVLAAYAVLRDPAQRANYDRIRAPRRPAPRGQQSPPAPRGSASAVIGTLDQARPAWIAPVDTMPARSDRPTPAGPLELLRDLLE